MSTCATYGETRAFVHRATSYSEEITEDLRTVAVRVESGAFFTVFPEGNTNVWLSFDKLSILLSPRGLRRLRKMLCVKKYDEEGWDHLSELSEFLSSLDETAE